jgi:hypothetical protein
MGNSCDARPLCVGEVRLNLGYCHLSVCCMARGAVTGVSFVCCIWNVSRCLSGDLLFLSTTARAASAAFHFSAARQPRMLSQR